MLNVIWGMILPAVLGFAFGTLTDAGLGYGLGVLAGTDGQSNTAVTATRNDTNTGSERRSLDAFLSSNPFKVSPQKPDTPPPPPPQPKVETPPPEPDTKLAGVILRGTLPGIGAWFDVNNEMKLVLIGRELDRYKLISVSYGEADFRRGNEAPVKKYIVYGPTTEAKAPTPPAQTQARPAPSKPAEPPKQTGNIVAAGPEQEGQVPSDLVQNPFDELKRIRMRPNEKAGGLEVQWIQNDSLLKRLGVQRGDIIRSVNGIPFTNMGDIANSISSLMTSERFDVEVTRGGQNTALRYVVK